jgi:hypothetical protein
MNTGVASMCPTMSPALWNPIWNADVDRAASLSKQVYDGASTVVKSAVGTLALTKNLWSLDSKLASLLESFYRAAEHPEVVSPVSEDVIRNGLSTLRIVCEKCDAVYNTARARGLTNRRFMGPALNSIRVRSDELLDIVETTELSLDGSGVDAIFDKALAELHSGATVKVSDL